MADASLGDSSGFATSPPFPPLLFLAQECDSASVIGSSHGDAEPPLEGGGRGAAKNVEGAVRGRPHPEEVRLLPRISRQFRQQFEYVGENGHDLSNKNNRASYCYRYITDPRDYLFQPL